MVHSLMVIRALYRRCLWFILSWSSVLCIAGVYDSFSHGHPSFVSQVSMVHSLLVIRALYRRCLWFILSWTSKLCIAGVYGSFSHGHPSFVSQVSMIHSLMVIRALYLRCLWFIPSWSFVSQVSMFHSLMVLCALYLRCLRFFLSWSSVLCITCVYGSFSHGPLYHRCLWFILSWSSVLCIAVVYGVYRTFSHGRLLSQVSMVHSLMVGPLFRRYRRRPTRTSVTSSGISSTPETSQMSWRKPGTSCVITFNPFILSFSEPKFARGGHIIFLESIFQHSP